jgi:hypothetical protein
MVGGFSESPMLRDAVERAFPNHSLIIPQEAGLAVLRGPTHVTRLDERDKDSRKSRPLFSCS